MVGRSAAGRHGHLERGASASSDDCPGNGVTRTSRWMIFCWRSPCSGHVGDRYDGSAWNESPIPPSGLRIITQSGSVNVGCQPKRAP